MRRFLLMLTVACSMTALFSAAATAQMINPFGVSNGTTLTKDDFKLGRAAVSKLLAETPAVGRYETWDNPVSANHGKLTILSVYTAGGMPCRKISSEVVYGKAGSAPRTTVLDTCKLSSGEWKIVP